MTTKLDVTSEVYFENNDGECLPLTKCVCGQKFRAWDFILSVYEDDPHVCPSCGRKLYFDCSITVYEVVP